MGRKAKLKKERNAINHCNITLHNLEDEGKHYKVQEYHPKNTSHMDYDLFKQMRIVGFSPPNHVTNIVSKLIYRYPNKRFAIAIEEDYQYGEHNIPIFSHPPLTEEDIIELEGLLNKK